MTGVGSRLTGHWHLSVSVFLVVPRLQIGIIFGRLLIRLIPGPLALKILEMIIDVSLFEHGSHPQGLLGS